MRTQKIKIRIGNSIMTVLDNGKNRITMIRPSKVEITNREIDINGLN